MYQCTLISISSSQHTVTRPILSLPSRPSSTNNQSTCSQLMAFDCATRTGPQTSCDSGQGSITCLAAVSKHDCVVTGHVDGQLSVLRGVRSWLLSDVGSSSSSSGSGGKGHGLVISLLQWHTHHIASLSSSDDEEYIFSGGEEGVLVLWHLRSGQKSFIPRLGAPISFCSTQRIHRGPFRIHDTVIPNHNHYISILVQI